MFSTASDRSFSGFDKPFAAVAHSFPAFATLGFYDTQRFAAGQLIETPGLTQFISHAGLSG
jgi:hypothetical protein